MGGDRLLQALTSVGLLELPSRDICPLTVDPYVTVNTRSANTHFTPKCDATHCQARDCKRLQLQETASFWYCNTLPRKRLQHAATAKDCDTLQHVLTPRPAYWLCKQAQTHRPISLHRIATYCNAPARGRVSEREETLCLVCLVHLKAHSMHQVTRHFKLRVECSKVGIVKQLSTSVTCHSSCSTRVTCQQVSQVTPTTTYLYNV